MKVQYDLDFVNALKRLDVRVRKRFKQRITIFIKNSKDPELNIHSLHAPYQGLKSINITVDYRAIYEEVSSNEEPVAYFIAIGTHKQLYKQK